MLASFVGSPSIEILTTLWNTALENLLLVTLLEQGVRLDDLKRSLTASVVP